MDYLFANCDRLSLLSRVGDNWRGRCVFFVWRSVGDPEKDSTDLMELSDLESLLHRSMPVETRYRGCYRIGSVDGHVYHEFRVLMSLVGEATEETLRRSFAFKPGTLLL